MSLRISSIFVATALLVSCGEESPEPAGQDIECAIGSGAQFSRVCILERSADAGAVSFLIHHPDGGFRRVEYDALTDEIGVGDGADTLKVGEDSTDTITEITIGPDRYRIPSAPLRASASMIED